MRPRAAPGVQPRDRCPVGPLDQLRRAPEVAAEGRELGAQARAQPGDGTEAVSAVLADCRYEPRADAAGITPANCPFHNLATEYTDLVCGMNINLLDGVLESGPATDPCARLDPAEGRCCVVLERQQQ